MVEWEYFIQEAGADRPHVSGWEPISVAAVQATLSVKFFVLFRRPR